MHKSLLSTLSVILFASILPVDARAEQTDTDCVPYAGTDAVLSHARDHLIVFGEMHGTKEGPLAVSEFVCAALNGGLSVRLGLETGRSQTKALDRALAPPFNAVLVKQAAPTLWSTPDGKGSEATLELLAQASKWREMGKEVSIFTFDAEVRDYVNKDDISRARTQVMVEEIDKQLQNFDGAVVILTGSFHAREKEFEFSGRSFTPMASLISQRPVISLDMRYGPGEAWVNASIQNEEGALTRKIGRLSLSGNVKPGTPINKIELMTTEDGLFDGVFFTGPISASPPAFPELASGAD